MSRQMDSNITRLLDGLGIDGEEHKLCDFTIADQNLIAKSQGFTHTTPSNFKPVLGSNVHYIVACVIINDSNEVLMVQEAKKSCAGKWYLPAGRMEKGETILQAAVREVLEEAGLECNPNTLILVETNCGNWIRFVFNAEVIGGKLKTKADKESLQAKWISMSNLDDISLRDEDILPLIEKAQFYKESQASGTWHNDILPAPIAHAKVLLRLIIVVKGSTKKSINKLHVLLSEKSANRFPTCEIHPDMVVYNTLKKFLVELFGSDVGLYQPIGLLNVEHSIASDGCCLTLLVFFQPPLEEVPLIGKGSWLELSHDVEKKIFSIINNEKTTIKLLD